MQVNIEETTIRKITIRFPEQYIPLICKCPAYSCLGNTRIINWVHAGGCGAFSEVNHKAMLRCSKHHNTEDSILKWRFLCNDTKTHGNEYKLPDPTAIMHAVMVLRAAAQSVDEENWLTTLHSSLIDTLVKAEHMKK